MNFIQMNVFYFSFFMTSDWSIWNYLFFLSILSLYSSVLQSWSLYVDNNLSHSLQKERGRHCPGENSVNCNSVKRWQHKKCGLDTVRKHSSHYPHLLKTTDTLLRYASMEDCWLKVAGLETFLLTFKQNCKLNMRIRERKYGCQSH